MRALVSGSSGFLGRALGGTLSDEGHEVLGLDRAPGTGDLPFQQVDLASLPHVMDAVAAHRPEIIFHAGALLSALAEADALGTVMGNASGTFHILEAARHFGARVVFTSTIATYGRAAGEVVTDDSPQFPSSIYGVTKVYGERLGEYYQSRYGVDFRAIRFPSIVGPGRGDSGLSAYSSLMIEKPLSGEQYTVPLAETTAIPILYIEDAVRGLRELAEAPAGGLERRCYLLSGISPQASEIAAAVGARAPGAEIRFSPDPSAQEIVDTWPKRIDDSAAASDWGWKSAFDLDALVQAFEKDLR